ncbi:MAG: phage major capsid protein [Gordonia paraffinivorans]
MEPALADSKTSQVSTVLTGVSGSALRVPTVGDDDSHVLFAAEGDELSAANPVVSEIVLPWSKIAALVGVSNEAIADAHQSGGGALEIIGRSLARSVANRIDAAAFGGAAPTNGWAGIRTRHADFHNAGFTDYGTADAFLDGIAKVRTAGGNPQFALVTPAVAAILAKAKTGAGSALPLFGTSAAEALAETVAGLQLIVSPSVATGTAYVIDPAALVLAVRKDAEVEIDTSAYFSKDSTAVRVTLRAAFGVANPAGIAKIEKIS